MGTFPYKEALACSVHPSTKRELGIAAQAIEIPENLY